MQATSSLSNKRPVIDANLRALLQTSKRETRLLGDIQRALLTSDDSAGRRNDMLHPSEISHSEWCPRASYHRLAGHKPTSEGPVTHWQMRMIFDEGKEIHKKWQSRIWDLGRLTGIFRCMDCKQVWWAISPQRCENCKVPVERSSTTRRCRSVTSRCTWSAMLTASTARTPP